MILWLALSVISAELIRRAVWSVMTRPMGADDLDLEGLS